MSVWAFACKNESSLNRWFDGTDQDVYVLDESVKLDFLKYVRNQENEVYFDEFDRYIYWKYIGSVSAGIGAQLLNSIPINEMFRKMSDLTDAVVMGDGVELRLSRAILRLSDSVLMYDYLDSFDLVKNVANGVMVEDGGFVIRQNINDQDNFYPYIVDGPVLTEHVSNQITKQLHDNIIMGELFDLNDAGKSFRDQFGLTDGVTKNIENFIGDESVANPIGSSVLNVLAINGENDSPEIITEFSFIEEVEIILTEV